MCVVNGCESWMDIQWTFIVSLVIHIVLGLIFLAVTLTPIALYSTFQSDYEYAVIPLFILLWGYSIALHIIAGLSDPGIIPRQKLPKGTKAPNPGAVRGLLIHGKDTELKWCRTCNFFRPPRTSHCATCDKCVLVFDHHCPFIGNCVGRNNYRYYLAFIWVATIVGLFIIAHSMAYLIIEGYIKPPHSWAGAFEVQPAFFVLTLLNIVPTLGGTIFTGALCFQHLAQNCCGVTTAEFYKDIENPENRKPWINSFYFWCAPRYPLLIEMDDQESDNELADKAITID